MNRDITLPDGIHEVLRADITAFEIYTSENVQTLAPMPVHRGGAYVRKGKLDAVIYINDTDRVVRVSYVGPVRRADIMSWLIRNAPGYILRGPALPGKVPGWSVRDDLTNEDSIEMLEIIKRRRNLKQPTGMPFDRAFNQTELRERGWTVSMIDRHIGNPNRIENLGQGVVYLYDTSRVYAAEATPAVQNDLLALEPVREQGIVYLTKLPIYRADMMHAALSGLAEVEEDAERANAYGVLADLVYRLTGAASV